MSTLRALIEQASEYAGAMYDPDDLLTPHYIAEGADGGLIVVAVLPFGSLDRLRKDVELQLKLQGVRRWVFFSEAYSASYNAREAVKVDPIDHPERIDVIMFDGCELQDGRRLSATRQVLDTDGKKRLMPLVIQRKPAFYRPSVVVAG